jgi:DNA-binding winged helix-turn-helix (wHTH) protein
MTAAAMTKHEVHDLAKTTEELSRTRRPAVLSFSPFRLDFVEERLWKGDRELRLRRKPFAILRYLAQNPRRLVTQAEIVDAVWGRIAMSESLLRTHVYDLRRTLGESVIETVVGRGYRFVANVDDVADTEAFAGNRHFEIVLHRAGASVGESSDLTRSVVSAVHPRVAKQLADTLAASGTAAVVVLVVAEAPLHDADELASPA